MFQNCKNEEDLKKLYKKLSLVLHPDKGGDHELMILLNEYYEIMLKIIKCNKQPNNDKDIKTTNKNIEKFESLRKYLRRHQDG